MIYRSTLRLAGWTILPALVLGLLLFPISKNYRERALVMVHTPDFLAAGKSRLGDPFRTVWSRARPDVGMQLQGIVFNSTRTIVMFKGIAPSGSDLFLPESLQKATLRAYTTESETDPYASKDFLDIRSPYNPAARGGEKGLVRVSYDFGVQDGSDVKTVYFQLADFPTISLYSRRKPEDTNCIPLVSWEETLTSRLLTFFGFCFPLLGLCGFLYLRFTSFFTRFKRVDESKRHSQEMARLIRRTAERNAELQLAQTERNLAQAKNPLLDVSLDQQKARQYKAKREIDIEIRAFEEVDEPSLTDIEREKAIKRRISKIQTDPDLTEPARQRLIDDLQRRVQQTKGPTPFASDD